MTHIEIGEIATIIHVRTYTSNSMQAQTHIPLAAVVAPLATGHPSDPPLPVIDCGADGPPRCPRCRAYINPFVRFIETERDRSTYICNFCGARAALSQDRLAAVSRPELELCAHFSLILCPLCLLRARTPPTYCPVRHYISGGK
jgi:hypothetical protein